MRKSLSILIALVLLVGGYLVSSHLANSKKKRAPKIEVLQQSVFVETVVNTAIPIQIVENGRLTASNKIAIYAEVQGVMEATEKEFKVGTLYQKNELLVKISDDDSRASLLAQRSTLENLVASVLPDLQVGQPKAYQKWNQYLKNFDVNKPINKLPETSSDREKYFITAKNIYTTFYKTRNLEITLQKYRIIAPFDGILTEAAVTRGSLVRPGQTLGEFIEPTNYELEVSVNKEAALFLAVGNQVEIKGGGSDGILSGVISRINGKVNLNSQTIKVFIKLHHEALREGMYLQAIMQGSPIPNAYQVASGLLVNGNQLYVVMNNQLKLINVSILYKKHHSVVVKGLENGMKLVSKLLPGAYAGMEVTVIKADQ